MVRSDHESLYLIALMVALIGRRQAKELHTQAVWLILAVLFFVQVSRYAF